MSPDVAQAAERTEGTLFPEPLPAIDQPPADRVSTSVAARQAVAVLRCTELLEVIDLNPTACRLLSQRREDILGRSLLDVIDDQDEPAVDRLCRRLTVGALEVGSVDVFNRGRDGHLRPISLTFSWLPTMRHDPDGGSTAGEFVVVAATPSPIVDDEGATAAIAKRAPDLIWRYRLWPERGFDYVSPSTTTLLGYPPSAFYAEPELMQALAASPEDREQLFRLYEGRFDPGESTMLHLRHRDGRIRALEQRTSRVLDAERRVLAVEAIGRDVTEREEAEAELSAIIKLRRRLHEAVDADELAGSEPASVLEAALVAVCDHTGWDVGYGLLLDGGADFNASRVVWHLDDERFEPLRAGSSPAPPPVPLRPEHDAGLSVEPTWALLSDRDVSERCALAARCGLRLRVVVAVPVDGEVVAELEFLAETDTPPPTSLLAALKDMAGEVGRALKRSHLVMSLRRTDEARSEFVVRAAHELRGPVGSISLMAAALAQEAQRSASPALSGPLSRLAAQAERTQLMATRLLELAQLEDGRFELRLQPVVLRDAVRAALAAMPGTAESQPDTDIDVDPSIEVCADPLLLDQIFTNLLTNARRYGGPHLQITARAVGDRVVIAVADDGPGVPPEVEANLFTPMRGSLATVEHAGLGLALVRQMTITLGGNTTYEPNEPTGARFLVQLIRA